MYYFKQCEAYRCHNYADAGNQKYCLQHLEEMYILKISSCDFYSKIKSVPSKSNDICCFAINCNESYNLVEDYIIINDQMVYHKFCITHHKEILRARQVELMLKETKTLTCDYVNCKKSSELTKFKHKLFCPEHHDKVTKIETKKKAMIYPKPTCNVEGCRKTARLIESLGVLWCKKHFAEQPNPEIFTVVEHKKYQWIENKDYKVVNDKNDKVVNDKNDKIVNDNKIVNDDKIVNDKKVKFVTKVVNKIENKIDKLLTKDVKNNKDTVEIKQPDIYDLLKKCSNSKPQICDNVCGAYDCKISKQLYERHQGEFCRNHNSELTQLRKIIKKHDGSKEELEARLKELQLRKFPDINHWKFAYKLWVHYQTHS